MSPSRIPRPGINTGSPSPGVAASPNSTANPPNPRSPGSPALGTIVHASAAKANNPFAQLHNKQLRAHGGTPGSPTPTQSQNSPTLNNSKLAPASASGAAQGTVRRRPKPPSPDGEDGAQVTLGPVNPLSLSRRPVPTNSEGTGTGGPRTQTRTASGPLPGSAGPRSVLRQPSTPSLSTNTERERYRGAHTAPPLGVMRARAASSASASASAAASATAKALQSQSGVIGPNGTSGAKYGSNAKTISGGSTAKNHVLGQLRSLPSQHLFEPSFAEHREPAVPPHIRVRLRLIHQLGVVLGIDAVGISGKIDIPGLLARVDAAYERTRGATGTLIEVGVGEGMSALPVLRDGPGAGTGAVGKPSGGMFGMFKRLGRRSAGDESHLRLHAQTVPAPPEGPAFGVPLCEAPGGSWCTSLIGGQRHELPLVVFTVVEEIYRRGMSQPGIFRLAGDGTRISSLTKVFNLPPLYGDSLSISSEPIHNLTGLVKRYVRDLPEPLLDESLFEAFSSFCVVDGEDGSVDALDEGTQVTIQKNNEDREEIKEGEIAVADPTGHTDGDKDNLSSQVKEDGNPTSSPSSLTENVDPQPSPSLSPSLPLSTRIHAAQILLKLLPPLHFSLFIYLLAFLGQLPLFPDNRLNVESISIIFGPAMCAARGKGITGLGPTVGTKSLSSTSAGFAGHDTSLADGGRSGEDAVSELVNRSQAVLAWLLKHWAAISEKVLDLEDDVPSTPPTLSSSTSTSTLAPSGPGGGGGEGGKRKKDKDKEKKQVIDTRLLSPIDLRGSQDRARKSESLAQAHANVNIIHASQPATMTGDDSDPSTSFSEIGGTGSSPIGMTRTGSDSSDTPSLSHSSNPSPASAILALPTPTTSPTGSFSISTSTSTSTSTTGGGGRVLRALASSGALRSSTSTSALTLKDGGRVGVSKMKSSPSSSANLGGGVGGGGGMKSSPSSGGLFARAFSSMSISSQAENASVPRHDLPHSSGQIGQSGQSKGPKRSASFTSLSSLVRKVGSAGSSSTKGGTSITSSRTSSADGRETVNPGIGVNSQITTVLGSLHDLLVSKDKQIERDARELALLRITLLEMDEKLQRTTSSSHLPGPIGINGCSCPSHPNAAAGASHASYSNDSTTTTVTPEITITSTPSSSTLPTSPSLSVDASMSGSARAQEMLREISDLQSQLSTALAGLETARQSSRRQADRVIHLESLLAKERSGRKVDISKLQVALALEQARCLGLLEERDLAKDRLEKVKTTLFSVA